MKSKRRIDIIPENERWLHTPQAKRDLKRAIKEFLTQTPTESDIDAILNDGLKADIESCDPGSEQSGVPGNLARAR